jgi:RNA polymerase-binding transcription factor DksA
MNIAKCTQKLVDLKNWYEGWTDHLAEQATLDSQSYTAFHQALSKQAAVEHNLKRIGRGEFGRCEACGSPIEEGRLETLLDSDDHRCATCAVTSSAPNRRRVSAQVAFSQRQSVPFSTALAPATS